MPVVRQTNFSAGELAPTLTGRTDLDVYARALRRCRDFFVSRSGAAVSRPGTKHLGLARNVSTRLIPFIYTESQSYVVELTHERIRIWDASTDALVAIPTTDGIASPYSVTSAADLDRFQFAQVGDVLTITHPSYAPRELTRVSHTSWTLTEVSYVGIAPVEVVASSGQASWVDVDANMASPVTTKPRLVLPLPTGDSNNPAREWRWYASMVVQQQATGRIFETTAVECTHASDGSALSTNVVPISTTKPITLQRQSTAFTPSAGYRVLAINIYRGRGDVLGFVGQTKTRDFIDVGDEPDYGIQPPLGQDPFRILSHIGALVRVEYPLSVGYFQNRRCFGGTSGGSAGGTGRGATLFYSATDDYSNYDEHFVHVAGEALVFELATRFRQEVRTQLQLDRHIIVTSAAIWSVRGHEGTPLDFDSVDAKVVEEVGGAYLPALSVDGRGLYVRAKGQGVRALVPANNPNGSGYAGVSVTELATHFFRALTTYEYAWGRYNPRAISDWCYAEDPWGLVWAARIDGKLLSLTLGDDTWGWALHSTDGYVLSVCAVPSGEEDAVYLAVTRSIYGSAAITSIERMTSRVRKASTSDDICLDCAIQYSGAITTTITGLAAFNGKDVWVVGKDNPPQGPFRVANAQVTLTVPPIANNGANVVLWVGLLYQPELETLDVAGDARLRQKTVVSVGFEVEEANGVSVGQDFDHLTEWQQREVSHNYGDVAPDTTFEVVPVEGSWDRNARAVLRQTLPLPVTVVGLTREVDAGG